MLIYCPYLPISSMDPRASEPHLRKGVRELATMAGPEKRRRAGTENVGIVGLASLSWPKRWRRTHA